jgi:class 3 adenylate cyclase
VEERKVVTVLFCDLVGFTARSDQADPEDVRALLRPYHVRLRREIERLGGTVDKFIGDGVMAVFGVPNVHEDDPERAVRCALRVLDAIAELNEATPELGLAVRIGIMTGEAAVILDPRPHETEGVVGDVVNTASRLQGAAPTGTVVVGEPTWWATRTVFHYKELQPVQVKGKAQPLPVWRAVAPRSRLGVDVEQRPATLLVGRDHELDLLRRLYRQTQRKHAVQLVNIVGEPGIGKSRLVRELLRFVDEQSELVVWRQGRCLPYGDGITFWALGEIVKAEAGVLESDDAAMVTAKLKAAITALVADQDEREWLQLRVAPLLGLAGDATMPVEQAEQFTAWRRFLEAMAANGPMILVVEDLHWADDALVAFLEHLLGTVRGVSLLIVITARPELFERHPGWPRDAERSTMIPLNPLDSGDTARLVGALLGRSRLPAELEASLLERPPARRPGAAGRARATVGCIERRPSLPADRAGAHRGPAGRPPRPAQGAASGRRRGRQGLLVGGAGGHGRSPRGHGARRTGRSPARRAGPVDLGLQRARPGGVRLLARPRAGRGLRPAPQAGAGPSTPSRRRVDRRPRRYAPYRPRRAARPPLHQGTRADPTG